ncbi:MAG: hypothetical protein KKF68_00860 [Nanoarchaeota archaeon]|nr:hypothetical protein [Nanoarchaeota archaeon]
MKKGRSLWDILAWVILASIFVWIILKVLGIINTPIIIEYAPYFGAVYLAGWAMKKLDTAVEDLKDVKKFNRTTVEQINNIKLTCSRNHCS